MELEEILKIIQSKSELSAESMRNIIDAKYEELGGLVTKQGAAYLIARQMGIDIPNNSSSIRDIRPTSRNVSIIGRIITISPVKEFKRQDGSNGSVASMTIADTTGQIRVTLWNDQNQMVKDCQIGDAIQVVNAMAKQNNFTGIEISIGKYGGIRKLDGGSVPSLERLAQMERSTIAGAQFGRIEITGTVMQVFRGNFIYSKCTMCGVSINGNCLEHGRVEPKISMVVSAVVDDSTGAIRAVMFGDVVKRICETDTENFAKMNAEDRYKLVRDKLEGNDFIFIGRVKQGTNGMEMMVEDFESLNPLEESKRLLDETKLLIGE